jgi:hypothetical protein
MNRDPTIINNYKKIIVLIQIKRLLEKIQASIMLILKKLKIQIISHLYKFFNKISKII